MVFGQRRPEHRFVEVAGDPPLAVAARVGERLRAHQRRRRDECGVDPGQPQRPKPRRAGGGQRGVDRGDRLRRPEREQAREHREGVVAIGEHPQRGVAHSAREGGVGLLAPGRAQGSGGEARRVQVGGEGGAEGGVGMRCHHPIQACTCDTPVRPAVPLGGSPGAARRITSGAVALRTGAEAPMIPTSPSRARTRRPRPARWRSVVTGVAALLMLATAAVGAPAASAASGLAAASTAGPTPSPSATLSGEKTLLLAPGANGVVRAGQSLTVTVELRNDTSSAVAATRVSLRLGASAITDRAALTAWSTGAGDDTLPEVAGADLAATASGATASATITLAPEDPALAGRAPGVYPLQATTVIDGSTLTAVSTVVVAADGTLSPLGVIVPITAPATVSGVLGKDELSQLTAADGALTAQLDAVDGTTAILAVDPAVPAAIRVLGTAAPTSALAWLDHLETLPNSRFALQFGDADVAVQLQAGLAAPLAPTSLSAFMKPADFLTRIGTTDATATPAPTPTPTDAPDGPVYPDLTALTDIGGSPRPAVFWPAPGSAGGDVVTALGALGTEGQSALTILPSTGIGSGAGGATVAARATSAAAEVLVTDAALSTLLSSAAADSNALSRAATLSAATAQLALASADAAGRPLAVALDRDDARPRTALRAAITAATLGPGVVGTGIDELAALGSEPVEVPGVEPDAARVADTTALLGDESALGSFATILDDPQLLTGPERAEMLQLLGVAWRGDATAAQEAVASHRAATVDTLDAVGIVSSNVILASYGSDFRPYVRNDLPYPVNLVLESEPNDSRLDVEKSTVVRALASSNTRVYVPISARIANATATVSMQLYSPTGIAIGAVESATVEVHAEWETIGIVVLSSLLALFILGGVIRTVRRRRRRTAVETSSPAPGAASSDD